MLKKNESGRSMVEMLGVLTIVGVLSVGGLNVINRMQNERISTQMLADLSDLARRAKKMACQYDSGYSDYTVFLYKSNAYPEGWTYDKTNKKFLGARGSTYKVEANTSKSSPDIVNYFTITAGNLSAEQCIKLATFDWGGTNATGIRNVRINTSQAVAVVGTEDYPMTLSKASVCKDEGGNTVHLEYNGCK